MKLSINSETVAKFGLTEAVILDNLSNVAKPITYNGVHLAFPFLETGELDAAITGLLRSGALTLERV